MMMYARLCREAVAGGLCKLARKVVVLVVDARLRRAKSKHICPLNFISLHFDIDQNHQH